MNLSNREVDIGVTSESLLFRANCQEELPDASPVFTDLNLTHLVRVLNEAGQAYDVERILRTPLHKADDVLYRQEIFRDLEDPPRLAGIALFCEKIAALRRDYAQLQNHHFYNGEKQAAFLELAGRYCAAVRVFTDFLADTEIRSRGLRQFREYMLIYTESNGFRDLSSRTTELRNRLADVCYCLLITADGFVVQPFVARPDYAHQLKKDFEIFQSNDDVAPSEMPVDRFWSHIDERLFTFVSELYPDAFGRLAAFMGAFGDFLDPTILRFEKEMQFFIAYLRCVNGLKGYGLPFCYPTMRERRESFEARDAFDIALALELKGRSSQITCNTFWLDTTERITVVTGPNQGGKTTFARMVGQLHYLAALGCPVPGSSATLFLCDGFFTHFERPEVADTPIGKLEDDLVRLRVILERASPSSLIVLNEIFTSTTFHDATFLSLALMDKLVRLGALVFWVTFVDELACYGEPVVSLVADGSPVAPFTFSRKPPSGLTHALALAETHGLTYSQLKERIRA